MNLKLPAVGFNARLFVSPDGRVNVSVTVRFCGPLVKVVADETVTSPSITISPDYVPSCCDLSVVT